METGMLAEEQLGLTLETGQLRQPSTTILALGPACTRGTKARL